MTDSVERDKPAGLQHDKLMQPKKQMVSGRDMRTQRYAAEKGLPVKVNGLTILVSRAFQ